MVAEPTAMRTWRMELRTASRKAWLAFSMSCQTVGDLGGVRQCLGRSNGITTAATTAIYGWSATQACAVAGYLSGKRVIGRGREVRR
jgi:hypothetical protein